MIWYAVRWFFLLLAGSCDVLCAVMLVLCSLRSMMPLAWFMLCALLCCRSWLCGSWCAPSAALCALFVVCYELRAAVLRCMLHHLRAAPVLLYCSELCYAASCMLYAVGYMVYAVLYFVVHSIGHAVLCAVCGTLSLWCCAGCSVLCTGCCQLRGDCLVMSRKACIAVIAHLPSSCF